MVVVATGALSRGRRRGGHRRRPRPDPGARRSVAQPAIPAGLVDGDAAAIDRLDRVALDRLLVGDVLRVKIWAATAPSLYCDGPS